MKILILSSSTGGGHNMRARSLTEWAQRDGGIETSTHQALESTHGLYRFGVETYNWIQRHAPWLHHLYFNYLEVAGMFKSASRIMGKEKFIQHLQTLRPDIIVSVHGSTNHGFFDLAREALPGIPCVTYCGELFSGYGFSKHWANPQADLFIGAVSECCEAATACGVSPEKEWTGGFLLDPHFYSAPMSDAEKDSYRMQQLGFDPHRFTLLLGTGAVGANNHLSLLQKLSSAKVYPQVIALCGKNEQTLSELEAWSKNHPQIPLKAFAYTREIPKLMQISEAIVARPGTGTTCEAIQSGGPIIHNGIGGIMPQEWITVKYTRKHQISETIHFAGGLPPIVDRWMKNPEVITEMKKRLQAIRPPNTPAVILERLKALASRKAATAQS
ncbi:MAG: glycosyltransferase [Verrucomicrobiota bacterium]